MDQVHDRHKEHKEPTIDCVCSKVMDTIASGEHGTQAQDEHSVNRECVAHVLG